MSKEEEKSYSHQQEDGLIYGIEGLCAFYHIGRSKASKLNSSGVLDAAKILSGRKLVFRKDILLTLNV